MAEIKKESPALTARIFFESVLPAAIAAAPERFRALRGTVAIAVRGDGAWTISLGDFRSPVRGGFDAQARLRLFCTRAGLWALTSGTMPGEGCSRSELCALGDTGILLELTGLLDRARSVEPNEEAMPPLRAAG